MMVMVLDFMQVHNFHGQTVNRVKILLFLELIIVLLCMFIIENKNILVFGEGPTQGLDDTTITGEVKYPINFTRSGRGSVLSLHYNESNSFLFFNSVNIYQFKAKESEIKPFEVIHPLFFTFLL